MKVRLIDRLGRHAADSAHDVSAANAARLIAKGHIAAALRKATRSEGSA